MPLTAEPTGHISLPYGDIAYWRTGRGPGTPLLCLHGGPGMPHDYLEPLAVLGDEREVIFYDQAGCGGSASAVPPAWTIGQYAAELAAVVEALGLTRLHLFGNSWGGWLALEYVLADPVTPPGSLVVSSSPPSTRCWVEGVAGLRAALPADVRAVLDEHEAAGTTDSREYRKALGVFNRRHMCRTEPWPAELRRAISGMGAEAYHQLWGESEFGPVTGALAGWDVTDRLGRITVPTLVTVGRYDEATPKHLRVLADSIPDAHLVVFEQSSHMAFLEEPEAYLSTLAGFLDEVDALDEEKTRV